MKTFIRKSGVFAIALLLANVFLMSNVSAQTITLTQPAQLTAVISGDATICIGQSTPVTVNVSGGTAPYIINGVSQTGAGPFTIDVSPTSTTTYDNTNITVSDVNSCGSSVSGSAVVTVNSNAAITSITGPNSLCFGTTEIYATNGAILGGGTGAWSSDNTSIVTIDASGNVTAVGPGTTNIHYTITGGCGGTASASYSITEIPSAAITSVTGGQTPLCIGATTIVTANDVELGGSGTGTWSSNNPSVATVDASGKVTAVSAGTADIIYTITGGCGGTASAQQSITVNPDASIASVTAVTTSLCINGATTATANGVVLGGDGTGAWSSDNTSVATVDASGNVTAVGEGTANIIYKITGGCGGTASTSEQITVNPNASIASVTGTSPVCIGTVETFMANSAVLGGGTGTWSSSKPAIAIIDATTGEVTAVNSGAPPITTIKYTITEGCGGTVSAQQNLAVIPNAAVPSVTGTTPLCIGVTANYTAPGASTGGGSGAWSSDNTAVVTVNSQTGQVTAVGEGTANIIFTITGGCGGTAFSQQSVTVNPDAAVTSVTGTSPLCINATATYTANGAVLGGSGTGAWSSDNIAVASVDASGNVTAISAGTANIIYTITGGCNGTKSAQQSITVNPDAAITSVTGGETPLCIHATTTVTANGVELGGTGTGAWSSSDESVATVDASGNVTAVGAGTADIIYTIAGGCNGIVSAQQSITVNPDAAITSVTGGVTPLCINGTTTVTANGVELGGSGTGEWSSSNPSVATVDTYGNVTAVGAGTANIIYTITGGCNGTPSAQQSINVNPDAAVTSVTGGVTPLCINGTTTVTANGVVLGSNGSGAWSSDNTAVASVDAAGNVTAISAGTANIIYTITGGCNETPSASEAITVNPDAAITSVTGGVSPICIGNETTVIANGVELGGSGIGAWSSDDNAVATVDSYGNVTAVGPGTANIIYTITGGCNGTPSASQSITVNDNSTISLTSSAGTDGQSVCIGIAMDNIIYSIGGGATGANVSGLPAGVIGSYAAAVFTISGTPTVSGTFNYTVTTEGPCDNPALQGTITVNANSSIILSSSVETSAQTVCINNPIADITYTIDDGATGGNVTGLPDGVTGSYNAGVFTISGTPTVAGTFNYTVTTEGPCVNPSLDGTIVVNDNSTISLSSVAGTDAQTDCINNAITNITYLIDGGATGANVTGLPGGVTGSYNAGVFTITGTPTQSGTFNYTVITEGPCVNNSLIGTITVNANSTISFTSATGTDAQTVCINNAITDITYSIGDGGTGANVSGLPAGVTGSYSGGVFTITGTPTVPGTFNYTVTTEGPCVNVPLSGTINVNDNSTISFSSGAGTDNQTVCINTGIAGIAYSTGGGATNASITAGSLPAGITGSYSAGVFTITGTPTEDGTFSYTIIATGPCVDAPPVSGTITVNPTPVINAVSNATYCNNTSGTGINFSTPTPGGTVSYTWSSTADVGFGTTGNGNISSFTATNSSNSPVTATITVTPHYTNNMVTCGGNSTSFTITVNPTPVVNAVTNKTYCNNTQGETVSFSSPTTGGTTAYSWTSSINIGFGTTGSGDIPSYTAVNNSINPVTATVTVTPSLNGCNGSPATFTITVNPSANAGTISGSSTICINSTSQLSSNGSIGGTWTSSNTGVASVNATTGLVTSASEGSTTIYYTVTNVCGASSSSFTINVNSIANAGTINGPGTVCSGSSVIFTSNGNSGGLWFTANPSVATVNSAGVVTGVNGGTTTIFYYVSTPTCGSANTSVNITVTSGGNPGIILGSSTMCAGSASVLITTGNSGGIWASTNTAVATIDPNNGFLIGQGAGNTTISYTLPSNSCNSGPLVAYFNLAVNPAGNAGTITGNSNICAGSTTLLSSNGSNGGTWYSGNNLVATVDPNSGLVTGVAPGNVLITYHVSNSCGNGSAIFPVSVSVGANAGTLSGPSAVCAGATINLTSNGNPGGVWTSSNTGAAIIDANGVVKGIGAGTTTITYTVTSNCSSSAISTTITVNPAPIAGTISGTATVCAGLSTPFTNDGTNGGTWSSSNPAAASVNSASGVVTGIAAGNAIITYTVTTVCGTVNSSAPVAVNPVLNAGTISGGSSVCMGATLQLNAGGNNGGQWTSSNTAAATVDANSGEVTPVAAGNTTITYTVSNGCGTSNATQLVTVNAIPNAGIVTGSGNVCAGLSTAYTSNGNSGGTWSSSNPAAATVNASSGQVTGVAAGTSIITYTVTTGCGTKSASANITVNPLPADGTITGPDAVCVNGTINLSSNITGGTWHSNSATIATVNASGQVSGVSAGTATITYTLTTTCGSSAETYVVTVNAAPDAGIIPATSSTLCVGSSVPLTHIGGMTGGTWRSLNPGRASVNPATGEVTGVSAGPTIIAYTVSNSCGTSSANLPIFVNSLPNAGTISGSSSVCAESTISLSASGDAGGTWTSNNTLVATVDASTGVVTGVAQGTASIIYTVGSPTVCGTSAASQLVTVNPLADAGIISGTTTVCTGLSTNLTSDGSVGGTWSSSNPAAASVNAASGVVTAVGQGTAIINYTVTNTCGSKTTSVSVTINPVPNAGTISGASSVCAGSTINLSSNVSGGTWSSSTHSVATVGPNTGIVTGIAQGNTTITYTVTTGCGTASTTYAVTVNPVPNAGTLIGTNYLCTGSSTTWYSNINGGTWSSSNTSTATVNPTTGEVTAHAAGNSTITYTNSSVCGIATQSAIITIGDLPNAGTVSGASVLCSNSTAIFTSNGTGGGSWSSNNSAAATVDPVTGTVTGVAAGSATITYTVSSTCGSSASSANITISALPNAGIVSGSSAICAGSLTTFNSNGTTSGSWSSNNNLVATVNSATGQVTGVGEGNATITYMVTNTCGTATSTKDIAVNALPNSGTVSGAATLCAESTTAFTTSGNGGGTWSSSDPATASVDPITGAVTGVAAGSATISYTVVSVNCGSSVASANITINPLPNPGTISGAPSVCVNANIALNTSGSTGGTWSSDNTAIATVNAATGTITGVSAGSTTITYTVSNGCGTAGSNWIITVNPLPNSGTISGSPTVCVSSTTTYTSNGISGTWTSDNTSIATVNSTSGLVTGVSPGNANIIYTVTTPCGTTTASAAITVIILPDAGAVSGAVTVCAGSTTTYTSNGLSGGTWSSGTPTVATVDANTGVVTGVAAGSATITYTFSNGCGTNSASQMMAVNPLPNGGTVSGAATVCIGATATYTTDGLSGGTWTSSNPAAASVNSTTGLVTGVAQGNATITYTSNTPCGMATASSDIAVAVTPNAGTVIGNTTVCVGANTTYTSDGLSGGTWSSDSPDRATVDPNTGVVTGVLAGNATIRYTFSNTCGNNSASQMITVNPLPNAGAVSGAATVCAGSIATFTSNGLIGGTWSSSNPAAASVNSTTGVVTGNMAGNAIITYTSTTTCGTQTATSNITVNPVLTAGAVNGSTTLCIGSTTSYNSDGSAGGTWASVTPSVATVNSTTGLVTGVSTGNATIKYTVSSSCGTFTSSQMIAVSPAANPGTISGSSSICTGSYSNFSHTGGANGGSWSSSNTSVAAVNSSGKVTGIGSGTAIISYSVTSGCGATSASKNVSVSATPTIIANNITVNTDLNECSAIVALGSNVTVTGSPSSLQFRIGFYFFSWPISATHKFYRGTTPVTVIASNSCGTVERIFLVTVVDNQPPTVTCKPNATRSANGHSSRYSVRGHEFDATATDGCGVASLIYSLSGATTDGFDRHNTSLNNVKLNIGTTTITWKATDVNGNVSTCSFTVTVSGGSGNHHYREMSDNETLKVKVAPNPSSFYFTLQFESESLEKVNLTVVDVMGRTIEQIKGVDPKGTLQIGSKYRPGTYIIHAVQGNSTVSLKLIKEGKLY